MRIGFALEYSLGHTTHAMNLKKELAKDPAIQPYFVDLPFDGTGRRWESLPVIQSNWSLRASLGAYLGLRRQAATLQSALFHTQVTSLFSTGIMRWLPSVVSLDATPIQFDKLGAAYGHAPSSHVALERLKMRLNCRSFSAAKRLVTWSEWTKDSLVADYGVPADKIVVIPPGIDIAAWHYERSPANPASPVNLLFVGADFARKGGADLLDSFRLLSHRYPVHLDIVTKSEGVGQGMANVSVHTEIAPNSAALRALFARADIFVFPTKADCLPLAVLEALASGLPVITTDVAAIPEAVVAGETGWIVPKENPAALASAIERTIAEPELRCRMGQQAALDACARFDAASNYRSLIDLVRDVA